MWCIVVYCGVHCVSPAVPCLSQTLQEYSLGSGIRSDLTTMLSMWFLFYRLHYVVFCFVFFLICFGLFCGSVLFVQCLHCPLLSSVYFFVLCLKSKSRNRNYHRTTNSLVVSLPYRVSTHALHLLHSDCIRERRQRRRCGWEIQ